MNKLIYIIMIMFSFLNNTNASNSKSFFDFKINDNSDQVLNLSEYKNNTILLVNVASNCGFTKQYSDLQNLYEKYKEKNFLVIAIPSNQFGGQEPGSNKEIKDFCETNFNITFPIMSKYEVKGKNAHPIYQWAKDTYGRSSVPKWNFHKILIDKTGKVRNTYGSFVKPMSNKIISDLENIL